MIRASFRNPDSVKIYAKEKTVMSYKKFIPCIYLYKGNAVKGFTDSTIIDTNPAALAKYYGDNNADELIVYDMSDNDNEHEEALDVIKTICSERYQEAPLCRM